MYISSFHQKCHLALRFLTPRYGTITEGATSVKNEKERNVWKPQNTTDAFWLSSRDFPLKEDQTITNYREDHTLNRDPTHYFTGLCWFN